MGELILLYELNVGEECEEYDEFVADDGLVLVS